MDSAHLMPVPQADRYPQIADRLPCDIEETEKLIHELHDKMWVLPPLDMNGDSECLFAGKLYQAMQAVADRLRTRLHCLRENEGIAREERIRRAQQQARIRSDMQKLHADGPRESYERAQVEQEQRCNEIEDLLARIRSTIERAEEVLAESAQCGVPSGGYQAGPSMVPQQSPQPFLVGSPDLAECLENACLTQPYERPADGAGTSLEPALDGLIGMGPLDTGTTSGFDDFGG